jgi:hypothetical protein
MRSLAAVCGLAVFAVAGGQINSARQVSGPAIVGKSKSQCPAQAPEARECRQPGVDVATSGQDNLYYLSIRMNAPDAAALLPQISQAMSAMSSWDPDVKKGTLQKLWGLYIYQVQVGLLSEHVKRQETSGKVYTDLTPENSKAVKAYAAFLTRGNLITGEKDPVFTDKYLKALNDSTGSVNLGQKLGHLYENVLNTDSANTVHDSIGIALVKMGVLNDNGPIRAVDPEVAERSHCPVAMVGSLAAAQLSSDPSIQAARNTLLNVIRAISPEAAEEMRLVYGMKAQPITAPPQVQNDSSWSDAEGDQKNVIIGIYQNDIVNRIKSVLQQNGANSAAGQAYQDMGGNMEHLEDNDIGGTINMALKKIS